MMYRWLVLVSVAVFMGGLALVLPAVATGQSAERGDWQLSRTPWGDPDLQGIWSSKTTTPLERPDDFDGREFLTEDDFSGWWPRVTDACMMAA